MLRTILWYLKFVFGLIMQIPNLKKAEKIKLTQGEEEYNDFVYTTVSSWAMKRIKDSGAKITVHNQERIPTDKNVLFISNHQSDFDIAIFLAMVKKQKGFIAKIELEKVPILGTWMKSINCVFMDRKDLKQSLETILKGIKLLKEGKSLVVFPEGTRSKSDTMGDFKAGSFKLATKSKVPIIPVTICGSYKIMEGNKYKIKPASVDVYIHEPIYTDALTKDELSALPETVKTIIQNKLNSKM